MRCALPLADPVLPEWSNRNAGSGTRVLIDQLLRRRPPARLCQPAEIPQTRVAAAILRRARADWGIAIATVARLYSLAFPADRAGTIMNFLVVNSHRSRPAVRAFLVALCGTPVCGKRIAALGMAFPDQAATMTDAPIAASK